MDVHMVRICAMDVHIVRVALTCLHSKDGARQTG